MYAIASDHAGYSLKEKIIKHLKDKGYEVKDFGTYSEESVDYPDYIKLAAISVSKGECERGIVVCGSGIGASIVANKIRGIRCALCHNLYTAEYSKLHNDANIIALGARVVDEELALKIIDKWIETQFEGGKHKRRIDKIHELEC